MNQNRIRLLARLWKNQSGQAMPWMAFLMVLFVGMGGITIDLGRAFVIYSDLQSSTNAAALAGGYAMSLSTATSASVQSAVKTQSSVSGSLNNNPEMLSVTLSTTLKCLTTVTNMGIYCSSSTTGDNAIQVVQTATVNTMFLRALSAFGIKSLNSLTMTAESTAAMRGASNAPYNVAIIVDTTASMGNADSDANCGNSRIYCALQGVQTLLQSLSPCSASSTSTSCTAFDQVSLFTFPPMEASTTTKDTACPTGSPTIEPYTTPGAGATWSAPTGTATTYQVTTFLSNYSQTNHPNGGLSTSSALGIAVGAKSGCSGLGTPGGDGTYYAGVIYAAQSALIAAQQGNPGSENAMIILSDGAANSSKFASGTYNSNGTYPSKVDQCQQAIGAANYASAHGTTVYTIAYGASTAGGASQCTTDPSLSPCSALEQMATNAGDFYSDATASQNNGQCTSASNPNLNLNQIFKQVATSFTVSRLIPNGST